VAVAVQPHGLTHHEAERATLDGLAYGLFQIGLGLEAFAAVQQREAGTGLSSGGLQQLPRGVQGGFLSAHDHHVAAGTVAGVDVVVVHLGRFARLERLQSRHGHFARQKSAHSGCNEHRGGQKLCAAGGGQQPAAVWLGLQGSHLLSQV